MPPVLLASSSPRRIDLLRRLLPEFDLMSSPVEETGSHLALDFELDPLTLPPAFHVDPEEDPRLWAWRKAADVALSARLKGMNGSLFLGADTIVVTRRSVLGKPKSEYEAGEMLRSLRGTDHFVLTGVALLHQTETRLDTRAITVGVTRVVMRDFDDIELEGYVATGESMDKAGAYAVQGEGGKLVERIEGCIANVVGLPLCLVHSILNAEGVHLLPYLREGYCQNCHIANIANIAGSTIKRN